MIESVASPRDSSLRQCSRNAVTRATQKTLNKDLEYTDCDNRQSAMKPKSGWKASRPIQYQLAKPINSSRNTGMPTSSESLREPKSSMTNSLPALQKIKKLQK